MSEYSQSKISLQPTVCCREDESKLLFTNFLTKFTGCWQKIQFGLDRSEPEFIDDLGDD